MKVALLNTYDYPGGAARACTRLQSGLSAAGVSVEMIVREQVASGTLARAVGPVIDGYFRGLADHLLLYRYPHRQPNFFSPAWVPGRSVSMVKRECPDLVHLHWVLHGFLQIQQVAAFGRPVVWTLHDSWPFTGGCHLPGDCDRYQLSCGQCPVLGSLQTEDLSWEIWQRKERAWRDVSLTIITPSKWIAAKARSSSLFRNRRIEIIPNGIDMTRYSPGSRQDARDRLGLPQDRNIILFGAIHALKDPNKGFDLLLKAIAALPENKRRGTELVVFGADEPLPCCSIPSRSLGIIDDEVQLVQLYQAADVVAVPSRQENLPYLMMEAMACGTPCVAFAVGGNADLVSSSEMGFLIPPFDIKAFANALEVLLGNGPLRVSMGARAHDWIGNQMALDQIVARHLDLYRQLLAEPR